MAFPDNPLEVFFDLVPTGAALYSPLYDASGELVDFRFVRLNPAGQRLLGLPAQPPRTLREYYPGSVPTGIFAQYRTAYLTGEASTYEVPYEGDGIDTYFRLVAQRSGDLLVVNFTDMGDLPSLAVEQSLRESRAREQAARAAVERERAQLQSLLAQAPVAIALLQGEDLRVVSANALIAEFWGYTPADVVGRPLLEGVPELQGQIFDGLMRNVMHTRVPFIGTETAAVLLRHGQLQTSYYDFVCHPHYAADGQVQGVIIVATDVTDQVRSRQQVEHLNAELETRVQARTQEALALNEQLTATNAELGESNRQLTRTNVDLDNFIYTASHDLKAPISNIEGLLLALEHELPAAARTGDVPLMLTMMQDAIDRFRRTITHLTDLSRLQKEHSPASDAVALAPVVEAVRLDLMPLLAHTEGELTVSIPEGLTVTFAEKNLRSVVYNLLSNAFKYRHPDRRPEVQLRSWPEGDFAVLEVQDNGLGMDLAQGRDKLFAMFQRLHSHVEGTGVGLNMVKRMVENAGGRIDVTSELGQGSTFRVYFPR